MTVPVVFAHQGNQFYMRIALQQARKHNDRVVLIGDRDNANIKGIEHAYWNDLRSQAFVDHYQHMSYNHREGALRGMMRWLVILEWMEHNHVGLVFYCDSDAMLYRDVTELANEYAKQPGRFWASFQIPRKPIQLSSASGHFSFWTLAALRSFRHFLERMYISERGQMVLQTKWAWHMITQAPGGVGDMTHLFLWSLGKNVINNAKVIDGHVFDHNVNIAANYVEGEYRMDEGIKMIRKQHGQFQGWHEPTQAWVAFDGLHFQGQAKGLMEEYRT